MCFQCLDSLEKSNAIFLGQIICFTHREITPKIFKSANYFSYNTKIDVICHTKKPRMHAFIRILSNFSAIELLLSGQGMTIRDVGLIRSSLSCLYNTSMY